MARILNFTKDHPALVSATRWQIYRGRMRECVVRALDGLGVPAALRSGNIKDNVTGDMIEIRAQGLFTRLTINGRDYYFDRLTGRFDGTGLGCGS